MTIYRVFEHPRCEACSRPLRDHVSQKRHYGPVCWARIGRDQLRLDFDLPTEKGAHEK